MNMPQSSLEISTKLVNSIPVIDLRGELDIYTAPRLKGVLSDLVSQGNYQLLVNVAQVEMVDSAGLGVIIGGLKRCRERNGSLVLIAPAGRVLQSLEITRLNKILDISGTTEEGIKMLLGRTR